MKLLSCYVASFGKLKDFHYDFDGTLNVINEKNGWGKSTFATFIKAMFYGLNASKRNVAENERMKFKPWNSTERFGGYVAFEWGGNEYKIERFFGAKEAEDSVRLFDLKTGKEFSNTENLGKRIFEIDEEGFLSTTYFSQKDFQIKSNTSLTAKFNSVIEYQDTELFDKVLIKLEDKAKTFKYRGDKGLISETKNAIYKIDENIDRAIRAGQAVKTLKQETTNLVTEVDALKAETESLTEKISRAGQAEALAVKKARYDELIAEKGAILEEIKKADKILNGETLTDNELSALNALNNDLLGAIASENASKEEVCRLEELSKGNKQKNTPNKKHNALLFGGIGLAVVGVALLFFSLIVGISAIVVGAILSTTFIFIKNVRKTPEVNVYGDLIATAIRKRDDISAVKYECENKLTSKLSAFNLPLTLGYAERIAILRDVCSVKRSAKERLEKTDEYLKLFGDDIISFKPMNNTAEMVSDLRERLRKVQNEYSLKANTLADKRATIKTHEDFANRISDFESEKAELLDTLSQYESEYKTLTLTIEYLKKADANLKIKYREPLQQSLNKYINYVDDQNSQAKIDIDLTVSVIESSGEKSTDYYSKGYQNLFEICKRFALTDVLFTGEKPFIILDDPFYNLDGEKLNSALNLIKKLSQEYQIIYFVCHDSRKVN